MMVEEKQCFVDVILQPLIVTDCHTNELYLFSEDYQELIEDIVRDGRLYASENHQEILKVNMFYICSIQMFNKRALMFLR